MRQLNRLNQFQRLWQASLGAPQRVSVPQLAERCFCSERHIRTLLRQLEEAGWLGWKASAGRGKRGLLIFHHAPDALRASLLETALEKHRPQEALRLMQITPEQLHHVITPLLGGRWHNDAPTLRIPYYRALEPLTPGFLPGRAEQHLACQIFSGLVRFDDNSGLPVADMAHHWQVSKSGLCWHFFLRPALFWHSGEAVSVEQLVERFEQLLTLPAMRRLYASVKKITSSHTLCLTFELNYPDYWLPYRLASYCSRLPHPKQALQGCGPFQLVLFNHKLVRLDSHDRYHLQHPLLRTIEYWITPDLFDHDLGTSCSHPVQIAIGQHSQLHEARPVDGSISLGFCYLAVRQNGRLLRQQAEWLIALIHHVILDELPVNPSLIVPGNHILPGWPIPAFTYAEPPTLPPELTLAYHLPIELHSMAEQLRLKLAPHGCHLKVIFHNGKSWEDSALPGQADIVMGDRLIGEAAEYTLEQWLRCDSLWPQLLNNCQHAGIINTLDKIQLIQDAALRNEKLGELFTQLMSDAILTPLFHYRYQISAPPGVNGIFMTPRGWFDFSRAWLPPPEGA